MNNRRRLQREYDRIRQSELKGITMKPTELSLFEWDCLIDAPEDSPYQNKSFEVKLLIPDNYPFSPPKARFMTRIFHPNIHFDTGEVCLDILKSKWSPAWSIEVDFDLCCHSRVCAWRFKSFYQIRMLRAP